MSFVPTISSTFETPETALWFAFHGAKLLVVENRGATRIPDFADLAELNVKPLRKQYLGKLDGQPCFSAELDGDGLPLDKGLSFRGLRELFDLMGEDLFGVAGRAFQIMDWDRTHQFCGRCGVPTQDKPDERAKVCPKCDLVAYPRISPAVIVAVIKDSLILLGRSTRFPYKFHSVLAGFVEPGETFEECVKREVREEVGIEVKNITYFGSQPWPFPNSLMVGFTATYDKGEIAIDENEIVEAGWFRVDDLPTLPGKISIARHLIDWFVKKYS